MKVVDWISEFNTRAAEEGKREMLWFPIKLDIVPMTDENGEPVMENGEQKMMKKICEVNSKYYYGGVKKVGFDDFTKLPYETIKKRQEMLKKDINGKYGFTHIAKDTRYYPEIDIDTPKKIDKYEELKGDNIYFKSATKSYGVHIIFEKDCEESETKNLVSLYKCDKKNDVECLNGQWSWVPLDTNIYNTDKPIKTHKIETLKIEQKKKAKLVFVDEEPKKEVKKEAPEFKALEKEVEEYEFAEIKDMLNIITPEFRDYYPDFIRIIFGLKNTDNKLYNEALEFTKKSPKFTDEEWLKKLWANSKSGCNIGTVNYYAQKSNIDMWRAIKRKYYKGIKETDLNDDDMAEQFLNLAESNYIYKDANIYCFHNGVWYHDKQKHRLKNYVGKVLKEFYNDYKVNEIEKGRSYEEIAQDTKMLKQFKLSLSAIDKASKTANINSITERVIHLLSVKEYEDVKFDDRNDLLPFKNGVYDLVNNVWVEKIRREDYILTNTGYDYIPSTPEEREKINGLLNEIFPDPEVRKAYINVLATCLWGILPENFCIANGSGGNGKGVLNELMMDALGINCGDSYVGFAYRAKNAVLLHPLKDGGDPNVANMDNMRMVVYQEPDGDNLELNTNTIKEITGGTMLNARKLYSNDGQVRMKGTHILEANKLPKLSGAFGKAEHRRFRNYPFVSTYTDDEELLQNEELENVHKADKYFKTQQFKDKYKFALLDILFEYNRENPNMIKEELYNPPACKEALKNFRENTDEIYSWVLSKCKITKQKEDLMVIKDLYREFATDDNPIYKNMSKKEKRNYNYKKLLEYLESSMNFRALYHKGLQTDNAKAQGKHKKPVLIGVRFKTHTEMVEDGDIAGHNLLHNDLEDDDEFM